MNNKGKIISKDEHLYNDPAVSVVMSVYNGGRYLSEAIESILCQTFKNFEFIIIDDGSEDDSLELIKKYMAADDRIVLISRANKGLPCSLNEGINIAKGEFIARMDADDVAYPQRLEKQIGYMRANAAVGILGTWARTIEHGAKSRIIKLPVNDGHMRSLLIFTPCFIHPTVVMRRKVLVENNLRYNEAFSNSQDYELWSRLEEVTEIANLAEVLLGYRVHSESITKVVSSKSICLRYSLLSQVQSRYLKKIGLEGSEKEKKFHFSIQSAERLANNYIGLSSLDSYITKLLHENNKSKIFDSSYLEVVLSKRFLGVAYHKLRRLDLDMINILFYKVFWKGLWLLFFKRYNS